MSNKTLVVYHKNCADGMAAAWAAYTYFGDTAEYLAMDYNDPAVKLENDSFTFPVPLSGRRVFVLDFSFSPDIHAAILAEAAEVVWLDHHKTAFEARGLDPTKAYEQRTGRDICVLDPHMSGCLITWNFFHPESAPPFALRLIDDRDRWVWQYGADTRNFATALRSKPLTIERIEEAVNAVDGLISEGAAMNALFDQQLADITLKPARLELRALGAQRSSKVPSVRALLNKLVDSVYCLFNTLSCQRLAAQHLDALKWEGLAANCTPQFASEAGNKLAEKSGTFGATWCAGDNGKIFFSLRSIGNYDVSEIARFYGGGGHKNAAGFNIPFHCLKWNQACNGYYVEQPYD